MVFYIFKVMDHNLTNVSGGGDYIFLIFWCEVDG